MSYTVETIDVKINIDAATVAQAIQGVKARLQEIPQKMDVQINPIMAQIEQATQKVRVDANISPMVDTINNWLSQTHNINVSASIAQAGTGNAQANVEGLTTATNALASSTAQAAQSTANMSQATQQAAAQEQAAQQAAQQHTQTQQRQTETTRRNTDETQRNSNEQRTLRDRLIALAAQSTLVSMAIQKGVDIMKRMTQAIWDMGKSGIAAAMELQEARGLFKVTFDGIRKDAEDAANSILEVFPSTEQAVKQEMALLANNLDGIGFNSNMALSISKTFQMLSKDMGSFVNVDSSRYFNALNGAMNGEVMSLARLGISVKENAMDHELLMMGIDTTSQKLSDYDKALLRTIIILQQTRKGQGDFARTMESPSNRLVRIRATLANISQHIGGILLPAVSALMSYVEPALARVEGWLERINELYGYKDDDAVDSVADDANSSRMTAEEYITAKAKQAYENINKKKKQTASEVNDKDEKSAKKVRNLLLGIDAVNKLSASGSGNDKEDEEEPVYTDLLEEIYKLMEKDYQQRLKEQLDKNKEKKEEFGRHTEKKDDAEAIAKANAEGRAYVSKDEQIQILDSAGKKQADTIKSYIDRLMSGDKKDNTPIKEEKKQAENERERRDALSLVKNYRPADNAEISEDVQYLTPMWDANEEVAKKAEEKRQAIMDGLMNDTTLKFQSGVEVFGRKIVNVITGGWLQRQLDEQAERMRKNGASEQEVANYRDIGYAPKTAAKIEKMYQEAIQNLDIDEKFGLIEARANAGRVRDRFRGTAAGYTAAIEKPVSAERIQELGNKNFSLFSATSKAAEHLMNFTSNYESSIKQNADAANKAAQNLEKAAQNVRDSKQEVEVTVTCNTDLLAAQVEQRMATSSVKRGKSTTYSYGSFGTSRWGYNR